MWDLEVHDLSLSWIQCRRFLSSSFFVTWSSWSCRRTLIARLFLGLICLSLFFASLSTRSCSLSDTLFGTGSIGTVTSPLSFKPACPQDRTNGNVAMTSCSSSHVAKSVPTHVHWIKSCLPGMLPFVYDHDCNTRSGSHLVSVVSIL
jgi:hypothetical protein